MLPPEVLLPVDALETKSIKIRPWHDTVSVEQAFSGLVAKESGRNALSSSFVGAARLFLFLCGSKFKAELKYRADPVVVRSTEEKSNPLGTPWVHSAQLGGLTPSHSIYYRITSKDGNDKTHTTPIYEFKSKAESNIVKNIRFAAFGDMGVNYTAQWTANQLTQLATSKPQLDFILHLGDLPQLDFILHLGDLAYTFGNWTKWNVWFDMMEPVASRTPYMIVPGNRDEEHFLRERFSMPTPFNLNNENPSCLEKNQVYYDFDYGLVAVVTLPFRGAGSKSNYEGCPQLFEWFEQTLERYHNRIEDPQDPLRWLVVAIHTPFYSSSDGHPSADRTYGGNKALKDMIEHLFLKYKVDIGVFGDDHNYERTHPVFDDQVDSVGITEKGSRVYNNPKSTMHFLIGTGGINLDGWLNPNHPPEWSAYREISHGFVLFDATSSSISGTFVRSSDGSRVDHFVIYKDSHGTCLENNWTVTGGLQLSQSITFWVIAVISGTAIFWFKKRGFSHIPFSKGR
ncbi:hypothetical protein PROFUN_14843 [Planoprotostelium fungivorum]|uniref:Calcineurin-like phosphoesterase domain-containing protein n=1 Tax=Planoprotostelium fungivorum TaxID=1890364 RepID=A0A2P6MYN0_9EUKA|nr:hypothetical protein PROFUN_14843 [Planoprotostelium fungivorum]